MDIRSGIDVYEGGGGAGCEVRIGRDDFYGAWRIGCAPWGKLGAFWGGFWGLLFGSAFFMIPGLGPILAAGPVVGWILAGLESAVEVGALSAVAAGLFSIGIPKDSIVKYESALKADQFVLIVHGTAAEVAKAKDIIATTHPAQYSTHSGEVAKAA